MIAFVPSNAIQPHACLDVFTQRFTHPVTRPVFIQTDYTQEHGDYVLEGFNISREEVEKPYAEVGYVLIKFCPFCGAPLRPEWEKPKEMEESHAKEPEGARAKGPVRAGKNVLAADKPDRAA